MADAKQITQVLLQKYPAPKTALRFSNALELLVATILSAQCTDARVNEVTRTLFKQYRTAKDYADADPTAFGEKIKPTGFYKNKANKIIACCRKLVDDFGGEVPATIGQLTTLPGVGRKTANVVLANAFGQQAITVDTHVLRVSNRLGLVHSKNAEKVEAALMEQVPQGQWTVFSHAVILHGRETCVARKPHCGRCVLFELCEWPEKSRNNL